jgi:hypothetical protein
MLYLTMALKLLKLGSLEREEEITRHQSITCLSILIFISFACQHSISILHGDELLDQLNKCFIIIIHLMLIQSFLKITKLSFDISSSSHRIISHIANDNDAVFILFIYEYTIVY